MEEGNAVIAREQDVGLNDEQVSRCFTVFRSKVLSQNWVLNTFDSLSAILFNAVV